MCLSYNCLQKKSLRLIDIPGHDRVRQLYFDKFKASARYCLILYVSHITTSSTHLYGIMAPMCHCFWVFSDHFSHCVTLSHLRSFDYLMNGAVLYHQKMFSRTLVHECRCLLYMSVQTQWYSCASSLSLYQVTVILITQPPDHVSGVGMAEFPLVAQTYFCDSRSLLRFQLRDLLLPLQPIFFTPAQQIFGPLCSCYCVLCACIGL